MPERFIADYERHVTTVKHFPGYDEYRPECKCGWVGSYWTIDDNAYAEASRHVREATQIEQICASEEKP